MRSNAKSACYVLLLSALGIPAVAFGEDRSGTTTLVGESTDIFGSPAQASVVLDKEGQPLSITLNLPMKSIENAQGQESQVFIVSLPEAARLTTFFDHISVDWNLHGHPPMEVYTLPHFDFHFYHLSNAEVQAIDCSNIGTIDPSLIPAQYVLPAPDAPDACVPQMGVHALPAGDLQPKFQFKETMIYGFYDSKMIFFEPMITQSFLIAKGTAQHDLSIPAAQLSKSGAGALPRAFSAEYEASTASYKLIFSRFGCAECP